MPLRSPLYCRLLSRWTSSANPPGSKSGGRGKLTTGSAAAARALAGARICAYDRAARWPSDRPSAH
eukprot:4273511-Alexandrium_andersonii.AAC.1